MARGKYQKRRRFSGLIAILIFALVVAAGGLVMHYVDFGTDAPAPSESTVPTTTAAPTTQPTTEPLTEPTTEPTTAPTEPFVVSTASVGVTGDILIHSPLYNDASKGNGVYDFSPMFEYIAEYYQRYDFMVANLEVTLSGADRGYGGYPNFNCPDSIVDALKDAGVDMLLNANNHTYDCGHNGFVRTQEVLNEKEMLHLGTRLSEDTPIYLIQDINGIKVGMLCYTYETGDTSDGRKTLNGIGVSAQDTELISSFHPKHLDEFYAEVEQALEAMYEEGAEATMVYIHWGEEYQLKPNEQQQEIAQNLCELGIDVIVGGHPHVLQPFDTLTSSTGHQTYCIYSVGNALSNQRRENISQTPDGHCEDSMIFGVTFEKWNDGSVNVAVIDILPIWVSRDRNNSKGNVYHIIPLDLDVEDWTIYNEASSAAYKYLKGSYKRIMTVVGDGYNECRLALGLPEVPMTAEGK